jgi:TIR domain
MAVSIFFSHSTKDRSWCALLAMEAAKVGVTPYLAEHDPRPGTDLAAKVSSNISKSQGVVVLLTQNTANSAYVHQEVGWAMARGKLVIPLVQPGIADAQLAMLNGLEYIPFDFEHPQAGMESYTQALARVAEKQRKREDDIETLIAVGLVVMLMIMVLSEGGPALPAG